MPTTGFRECPWDVRLKPTRPNPSPELTRTNTRIGRQADRQTAARLNLVHEGDGWFDSILVSSSLPAVSHDLALTWEDLKANISYKLISKHSLFLPGIRPMDICRLLAIGRFDFPFMSIWAVQMLYHSRGPSWVSVRMEMRKRGPLVMDLCMPHFSWALETIYSQSSHHRSRVQLHEQTTGITGLIIPKIKTRIGKLLIIF